MKQSNLYVCISRLNGNRLDIGLGCGGCLNACTRMGEVPLPVSAVRGLLLVFTCFILSHNIAMHKRVSVVDVCLVTEYIKVYLYTEALARMFQVLVIMMTYSLHWF
ncbi:hypothetical protein QBC46DRAFT_107562 [Diplogelasinospora grovesii]|uniref:Uncharacterized protein n=1 Tax=Diplogelasinospora grovesii TaxID=303347 RepID=A0AAN6N8J6_9PEZI|nr:hypothetical protein QBC46DRAFT_107562 [Diplogelasinospora grovesii]